MRLWDWHRTWHRNLMLTLSMGLISTLGCGGGGGASSSGAPLNTPVVAPPSDLAVKLSDQPLQLLVQWKASASAVDGYWLEGAYSGQPYQRINSTIIPPQYNAALLTLQGEPPEGTDIAFRLRASVSGVFSNYTNEAHLQWVASPAAFFARLDPSTGGVRITWNPQASALADGVLIERTETDLIGNPTGSWGTLGLVSMSKAEYLDSTVQETRTYQYRLTNCVAGNPRTFPLNTTLTTIPCLPPASLAAIPQGAGFHLAWQNRSQAATKILVKRGAGASTPSTIATLPAGATTYDDSNLPLGYYSYQIGAANEQPFTEGDGSPVSVVTGNPTGAMLLTGTDQAFPHNTNDAAMRSQGNWALGVMAPLEIHSNNDPWPSFAPGNDLALAVSPSKLELIQLDALGYPHTMYLVQSPTSSKEQTLVHAWFDGSQWQREDVSTGTLVEFGTGGWARFWFCLDSKGSPRVLLDHVNLQYSYGMSTETLTYLSKINGVWTSESLASISPTLTNLGGYRLSLDPQDNPHVFLGNWLSIYECFRASDGAWTGAPVAIPTGTTSAGTYDFLESNWIDRDNGSLFFFQKSWQGSNYATTLTVSKKVAGQWQPPVSLGSGYVEHECRVCLSEDRTRLVAALNTDAGLRVFESTTQGWIETLVPLMPGSISLVALGMDGNHKVHLLVRGASGFEDLHE